MWFHNPENNYFYVADDARIEKGHRIVTKGNMKEVYISIGSDVFSMYGGESAAWKIWWYKTIKFDFKVEEKDYQRLNRLALKKVLGGSRVGGYRHV